MVCVCGEVRWVQRTMVLPRELAIRRLALIIIRINRDAKRRCRIFAAERLLTSSESGHRAERFKKAHDCSDGRSGRSGLYEALRYVPSMSAVTMLALWNVTDIRCVDYAPAETSGESCR